MQEITDEIREYYHLESTEDDSEKDMNYLTQNPTQGSDSD